MSRVFNLNIPISKVDEEQRIVTGIATTEALDSQGDIVDFEASKKAFSDWIGNIREMHGPVAIGKAIDVEFDDAKKQVIVSAKISESADGENAWIKVKEEILTGFSIGGKVFKVAKDKAVEGATRILDYSLSELSLVDNPACPEAQLIMVKSVDGGLQRVEAQVEKDTVMPEAWWVNKFMGAPMKKSVFDAAEALNLAMQLTWLITVEEPDQREDLVTAFNALRDFAGKEVAEGDDYALRMDAYDEVIELATKAINLRKGKFDMADKKVKKTNVVGGEERDHEANVTQTQEEAGRPAGDTTERAAAAAETTEEKEAHAETEEAKTEEKTDDTATEEAKDEKTSDDEKKSDDASDLVKNVQALLTKLADSEQGTVELKKVADGLQKSFDKVAKSVTELEGRIVTLEKQPVSTKGKQYHVVGKGDSEDTNPEVAELLKRQEELIANPHDAKPGEMADLALKLRKASLGEPITINKG